jgi:hypothetical protein
VQPADRVHGLSLVQQRVSPLMAADARLYRITAKQDQDSIGRRQRIAAMARRNC